jgi:hypothetical protein
MSVDAATDALIRSTFLISGTAEDGSFLANSTVANQFNAFINIIEQSSILVSDIEALRALSGPGSIVLGAAGGGLYTSFKKGTTIIQITLDPNLFTNDNLAGGAHFLDAESLTQIATDLGHELGHATQPGGFTPSLNKPSPSLANSDELGDEGVAETNAYYVAQQLNTTLPGIDGAKVENDIKAVIQQDGVSNPNLYRDEVNKVGADYATFNPSTAPNLTYTQYNEDQWIVAHAGGDNSQVNWSVQQASWLTFTTSASGTTASGYVTLRLTGTTQNINATFNSAGQLISGGLASLPIGSDVAQGTATLAGAGSSVNADISGTGIVAGLSGAAVTLAAGASATVDGSGNDFSLGNGAQVTIDSLSDNFGLSNVTFDAGTYFSTNIDDVNNTYTTELTTAPDSNGNTYEVGTLVLNTSSGTATITLPDGAVISIASASGTLSAPTAGATALQTLVSDLSALGGPSSAAALEAADIAHLHPAGTAYTLSPAFVAPQDSNTSALVDYELPNGAQPGAIITGQTSATITVSGSPETVPATNELDTNGNTDLSVDSISGIQELDTSGSNTVYLTAAQMGPTTGFSDITGGALSLVAVGPGSFSLAASNVDQDADYVSLSATSLLGTQLTGNATAGQELAASTFGHDTLTAGNGANDILTAGEGVDAITGGTGHDTFVVANTPASGTSLTGHGTGNTLQAGGDLTGATITDIQTLHGTGAVALTASQFAGFTGVTGSFTLNAATGGTYNLAGDTGTSSVDMTALSNAGTTLVAGASDETLTASDSGNDTLTGAGTGDTLIAGSGEDTLTGGTGSTKFEADDGLAAGSLVTGSGTGNVLDADGDISAATISGVQTLNIDGDVTVTSSQLAGFTSITGSGDIDVANAGTFDLATSPAGTSTAFDLSADSGGGTTLIGNSAGGETLTASDSGNDTLEAGNGGYNTLYAGGGNDTLDGGNGGHDTLVAGSGVDTLTGGTGSANTFIADDGLASGSSLASHGSGDTFEADGSITGATITGTNIVLVVAADPEVSTDGLTLNQSQLSHFSSFGGTGAIFAATSGTYNLGTASLSMTAQSSSATTLEETGATGVTLTANASGNDTLEVTGGSGNTLTAAGSAGNITLNATGGTLDTLIGGSGTDTYVLNSAVLTGTTITGGSGAGTISVTGNAASVSEAVFSNIQTISSVSGLSLTSAQMAGLTHLNFTGFGADVLYAATSGTYNLPAVNTTSSVDMYALASAGGTTLTGNNVAYGILSSSTGRGDVLQAGNGALDTLDLYGTNVTANAGSGGDYVNMFEGTATVTGNGGTNLYDVYDDLGTQNNVDTIDNYHAGSNSSEVYFADGAAPSGVVLTQSGENLVATVIGQASQVVVVDYFASANYQVNIGFSNGTTWNAATVASLINNTPITPANGSSTTYTTSGTTIDGGSSDYIALSGSAETVALSGSGSTVSVGSGSTDNVLSDGSSSSGNLFYVSGMGSVVTMSGSSDTASLHGNYDTAADASGSSGNSYHVYGSYDAVTLNGSSDTANLFGSNETATLNGNYDSVSDAANSGNAFNINGSHDTVTVQGTDETASDLASDSNDTFYLYGNGDTAILNGTSDTAVLFGSNKSVYANGNSANVYDGGGDDDNSFIVSGSHDTATLAGDDYTTYDGTSDSYNAFNLYGTGDIATLNGTHDSATLAGNSESVTVAGGYATLSDWSTRTGNSFTLNSSHDTVSPAGSDDTASDTSGDSGNAFNLYGASDTATLNGTSDSAVLAGGSDSVTANGGSATLSDWGTATGNSFTLNSGNDTVSMDGTGDTASDASGDTGNRFNFYGANNSATVGGSSDTGTLNQSDDSVTVSGSSDSFSVNGASDTVSDSSAASGNSFSLNGNSETATLAATNDTVAFYGTGSSATVSGSTGHATFGGTSSVLAITGTSSENVYFNSGATGTLKLEAPAGFTGTVAGLADADAIDLTGFQYSGTPTISSVTGTGAAGTNTLVTITDDGISTQLALLNQYANQFGVTSSAYTLTADGTGTNAGTLFQLAPGH